MIHEVSQQQAFEAAVSWADELGCEGTDRCILLERNFVNSRVRTIIRYGQQLPQKLPTYASKLSDVMGMPVG
jgi:hypothetical protein